MHVGGDGTMKVPFIDLKTQYEMIVDEISVATKEVFDLTSFAGGPLVERFEKGFATFCQSQYAVGVGSGTEALWLTLLALGVGQGDEVVTVPNTFIATAEAISFCGATPVFVDINEDTYTMDPALLQTAITPRTKAIIPVHLFGQMADMDPIMQIANNYGLFVVEDACQAHGAEYKGRPAGSIGHAGCFSFYPGKNLGAYGEAGAVVTNNFELATKIRMLRDHGQLKKYHHPMIGWNARMDGLQAAVLRVKLTHLHDWNDARRRNASLYHEHLRNVCQVICPTEAPYAKHVYHIYAIRVQDRDRLIGELARRDIHCGVHYPVPVHLQEAYCFLGLRRGTFPISELISDQLLSLPMFPELTPLQIERVVTEIRNLLSHTAVAGPSSRLVLPLASN